MYILYCHENFQFLTYISRFVFIIFFKRNVCILVSISALVVKMDAITIPPGLMYTPSPASMSFGPFPGPPFGRLLRQVAVGRPLAVVHLPPHLGGSLRHFHLFWTTAGPSKVSQEVQERVSGYPISFEFMGVSFHAATPGSSRFALHAMWINWNFVKILMSEKFYNKFLWTGYSKNMVWFVVTNTRIMWHNSAIYTNF